MRTRGYSITRMYLSEDQFLYTHVVEMILNYGADPNVFYATAGEYGSWLASTVRRMYALGYGMTACG